MLARSIRQQTIFNFAKRNFSAGYHSLDDQIFYVPVRAVKFEGDRITVFDNRTTKETRYVPWAYKESAFKNVMGLGGTMVWSHMHPMGFIGDAVMAAWVLNWAYTSWGLVSSTVRHVELNKDGKTVMIHPLIGSSFSAKIKDIKKLEHEKTLVETFEDAFMFPIEINGVKWHLHGNGQESIRNGEIFRAIINGQSIKL